MRILISNDDGYKSEGVIKLAEELGKNHIVTVVSPHKNCSGKGHAITITELIEVRKIDFGDNAEYYTTDGTPADCVNVGINLILKDKKPDIVITGINDIHNLGKTVYTSGTVGSAREGALNGIISVAISSENYNFIDEQVKLIEDLIQKICNIDHETKLYNINLPDCKVDEIKGVKFTRLGDFFYLSNFTDKSDGEKTKYCLKGSKYFTLEDPSSDIYAIQEKYISITPMRIDTTENDLIEKLNLYIS